MKELFGKAVKVLESLGEEGRAVIQKDNPFRKDRDKAIRKLRARGVTVPILVEITGLSRVGIYNILGSKPKTSKKASRSA